jgi:hypothetical protein
MGTFLGRLVRRSLQPPELHHFITLACENFGRSAFFGLRTLSNCIGQLGHRIVNREEVHLEMRVTCIGAVKFAAPLPPEIPPNRYTGSATLPKIRKWNEWCDDISSTSVELREVAVADNS